MRCVFFFFLLFIACNNNKIKDAPSVSATSTAKPQIRVETFNNSDVKNNSVTTGYGYRIYMNDTLRVEQPNIPAAPGNNGFANEADAFKTASLVKSKIESGIMPPTISLTELDSMMVKY